MHGSSVAGLEKTVESTRGEDGQDPTVAARWWRSVCIRLSCPLLCKTEVQTVLAQFLDKVVLPFVVQDRRVSRQCRNL